MQFSDLPTPFALAWAANAGAQYKRIIPVTSQIAITPGAASLNDGFPPLCFSPIGAGGVPPAGADFNGILNEITAAIRFFQAGGGVPFFDATFASQIGGYPLHAMLQATAGAGQFWISTIDNNSNNPDTGGAGWSAFPGPTLVQPSTVQTTNATFGFNCATDVSLGLDRASPAAMVVNLAASGTLILNQVFEIEDLSGNLSLGPVTVNPPSGQIAGAASFIMNKDKQSARFKYYGGSGAAARWSVRSS